MKVSKVILKTTLLIVILVIYSDLVLTHALLGHCDDHLFIQYGETLQAKNIPKRSSGPEQETSVIWSKSVFLFQPVYRLSHLEDNVYLL